MNISSGTLHAIILLFLLSGISPFLQSYRNILVNQHLVTSEYITAANQPINANMFAKENKVLIIGIDGCRPDALLKANTVFIDKLIENGAYSFKARTDEISSSGTCWTGMLTGVWHNKHNVISNEYKNPNMDEYPHFFHRVKLAKPGLSTYSIAHWAPVHKILQDGDADVIKSFQSDDSVTVAATKYLSEADVDIMFIHFDEVDHAGHTYGYGPEYEEYLKAIENADQRVGQLISALESRQNYENENWLIMISTDHGGSETGHGKNIPEHTTIFYIVSGKDAIKGEIKKQVFVIDVTVTALTHLQIDIEPSWNLDGQVSGLPES